MPTTDKRSTPLHWHTSAKAFERQQTPELKAIVDTQSSLHQVAQWAATSSPSHELVDCIDQDEFNRDLVIRYADSGLYLVYDCS